LGLACARAFADEGANVVLAGRRADVAEAEASALPSAVGIGVDLNDDDAPRLLFESTVAEFGAVDVLVLNSGGPPPAAAVGLTPSLVQQALHTLLVQQQRLVELVLPGMRERRWGRVVSIGSTGVQQPLDRLALSNMGRAALAGYLKTLATEVAADGVTVNMVLPGRIETDRVRSIDAATAERLDATEEEVRAHAESMIPAGRYGRAPEFASAVVFLASERASYITGEQLRCDGGLVRAH
jgi:3-oxoacyl-[acyl-carrier protein] reductase